MAIKNVNELGFTVYTTNEGVLVGEADFFYEEIGLAADASDMARWAVRNGFSQALVDTGAGKSMEDRRKAFLAKVDRFRKNIVPADSIGGGRALTPLEHHMRYVVALYLTKAGEKKTIAKEKATDPESLALEIGQRFEKLDPSKYTAVKIAAKLMAKWTTDAQKRVEDDAKMAGEAIDLAD